jgi:hypothetical protein
MNLKQEAKGRECQIRIPGVCNNDRETVVLAHLNRKRLFGVGMGQKVPDIFGAFCCSACHDAVDWRSDAAPYDYEKGFYSLDELLIMHMEGVFRTQNILLNEGKIKG